MVGNDLQMTQGESCLCRESLCNELMHKGVALVITGLSSSYTMSLYHLHLVYDTVSFVG